MGDFLTDIIKNMNYMFYYCKSLEYLNISKLKTKYLENFDNIFTGVNKSITLIIPDDINENLKEEIIMNLNISNDSNIHFDKIY